MRDVWKVSLLYTLIQCTLLLVMRDVLEGEPAVHTCTVYTPIGDEGCPEGEPAVGEHACTVYTPVGDEGQPVYTHSVHPYW